MKNGNHPKVCPAHLSELDQEEALQCTVHVSLIAGLRVWAEFVFLAGNQACLEMSSDLVRQAAIWYLFLRSWLPWIFI